MSASERARVRAMPMLAAHVNRPAARVVRRRASAAFASSPFVLLSKSRPTWTELRVGVVDTGPRSIIITHRLCQAARVSEGGKRTFIERARQQKIR